MKKFVFLTFLFCCCFQSYGQQRSHNLQILPQNNSSDEHRTCGTDDYMEQLLQDPVFRQNFLEKQAEIQDKISQLGALPPCTNPLIIPVAVHYGNPVTNANPQCLIDAALAQIEQMNLDYAGCNANAGMLCDWINAGCDNFGGTAGADAQAIDGSCIKFCLADQNLPGGEDNIGGYGITVGDYTWTGGADAPAWAGYMNIFVGDYLGGGILGVAPLNGASNPNGNGFYVLAGAFGSQTFGGCTSGTAIDNAAPYDGGATCTHEAGHYFGLEHTFSGAEGLPDTPAQTAPNYGCPTVNTATCTSSVGADYSGNFMDYVDDDCMHNFSEDQVNVMQAVAAPQAAWATGSISCDTTYDTCPQQGPCLVACPTVVTTPYSDAIDHCASAGAYTLPTDFSSVVLDDNSDATYTWSTGGYISAGGTALAGPDYALTPPSCAPVTETLYLNVGCTSDAALNLDAGTLDLTIYPDPATFVVADLVTFTDGDCAAPTWVVTAGCEAYVTVDDSAAPATVNAGDSGSVDYPVTLTYPAACCATVGAPLTVTATIGSTTLTPANSDNTCVAGTSPEWWEIPFTIPALANATTVGTSSGTLGSIEEICLDVVMNESQVAILSLDVPNCGGYNWENLWEGAAFGNTTSAGVVNVCFTPGTPDSDFDGTFDGDDGTDGTFAACDWTTDNFILYIADFGCYLATPTPIGGVINSATVTINDGNEVGMPICDFTATAAYDCMAMGVGYCDNICFAEYNAAPGPDDFVDATLCVTALGCADNPDATCLQTLACDDNDQCTENEMETTVIETGEVCTACGGGTAIATCTLPPIMQACDDNDPCTENDMVEVDACDTTVFCGTCTGTPVTPACGDPTATNYDMNATCIDNTLCTYGSYCDNICYAEYAPNPGPNDMPDVTLCVTPLGCADNPDASCIGTQACDDNDTCTTGEEETYILANGVACGDCGLNATPVTPGCGDPMADNYDPAATCIDNTLCTYTCEDAIAGTITLMGCDFTGTTVTIYDASGTVVGTAMADAMGNYMLAGPFTCGTYSAELTAAPPCYIDENGDVGPRQFVVDGDGTPDGFNFVTIPANIPTVGEWGLIILGLMMSIVAVVGIRARREEEVYG